MKIDKVRVELVLPQGADAIRGASSLIMFTINPEALQETETVLREAADLIATARREHENKMAALRDHAADRLAVRPFFLNETVSYLRRLLDVLKDEPDVVKYLTEV